MSGQGAPCWENGFHQGTVVGMEELAEPLDSKYKTVFRRLNSTASLAKSEPWPLGNLIITLAKSLNLFP